MDLKNNKLYSNKSIIKNTISKSSEVDSFILKIETQRSDINPFAGMKDERETKRYKLKGKSNYNLINYNNNSNNFIDHKIAQMFIVVILISLYYCLISKPFNNHINSNHYYYNKNSKYFNNTIYKASYNEYTNLLNDLNSNNTLNTKVIQNYIFSEKHLKFEHINKLNSSNKVYFYNNTSYNLSIKLSFSVCLYIILLFDKYISIPDSYKAKSTYYTISIVRDNNNDELIEELKTPMLSKKQLTDVNMMQNENLNNNHRDKIGNYKGDKKVGLSVEKIVICLVILGLLYYIGEYLTLTYINNSSFFNYSVYSYNEAIKDVDNQIGNNDNQDNLYNNINLSYVFCLILSAELILIRLFNRIKYNDKLSYLNILGLLGSAIIIIYIIISNITVINTLKRNTNIKNKDILKISKNIYFNIIISFLISITRFLKHYFRCLLQHQKEYTIIYVICISDIIISVILFVVCYIIDNFTYYNYNYDKNIKFYYIEILRLSDYIIIFFSSICYFYVLKNLSVNSATDLLVLSTLIPCLGILDLIINNRLINLYILIIMFVNAILLYFVFKGKYIVYYTKNYI